METEIFKYSLVAVYRPTTNGLQASIFYAELKDIPIRFSKVRFRTLHLISEFILIVDLNVNFLNIPSRPRVYES